MQLEGLKFYGYHGVHDAEQQLGQRFIVDLEMELDLRRAGLSDDPSDTVNYSLVYQEIKSIITACAKTFHYWNEHVAALQDHKDG